MGERIVGDRGAIAEDTRAKGWNLLGHHGRSILGIERARHDDRTGFKTIICALARRAYTGRLSVSWKWERGRLLSIGMIIWSRGEAMQDTFDSMI
jgi:hypothetical protein